jgi:protoporphyrinogen oxidase
MAPTAQAHALMTISDQTTPESPATASDDTSIVIIGAGPAGLTAAYELSKRDASSVILEASDVVGGISQTVEREGWRFDIGGHRFFTKVTEVEQVWHELLTPDEFMVRPRLSRIFYKGKFFDYPLKASNALGNLGVIEAIRCVLSYLWVRIHPPKDLTTFEGWVASRFGWRLYRIFFKTYTEKVWGVPATELQADWAAQRIKNLSLAKAIFNALKPTKGTDVTSLIEEFHYPKYGPGMMWERCADVVTARGSTVVMEAPVEKVCHSGGQATSVVYRVDGEQVEIPANHVVSSMPISQLVRAMDPPPPAEVVAAADNLAYRDFLTIALVVPESVGFPDNWIYVHEPQVRLGRIQNFGQWSPWMVKDGRTCLGLEYFVFEGDDLWMMEDDDLVALGTRELASLGLVDASQVQQGYVVRVPKAYPMYDDKYKANVDIIRAWIAEAVPNVYPVGRNGMHKYNNQDHSMFTAMLTVENIFGAHHDIWDVNVEEEYHEESTSSATPPANAGTGRAAPEIPKTAFSADHPLNRSKN